MIFLRKINNLASRLLLKIIEYYWFHIQKSVTDLKSVNIPLI